MGVEPVSESSERDFIAEMRAIIDAETSSGPYISGVVAEHIVEKLRANDPELLDGWLNVQAASFLRHAINLRDCSARTYARTATRRGVFAKAAQEHEAGNSAPLVRWLNVPFAVEDGSRKRLADLTAADLDFAASTYEARAAENAMTASFLRALRKKVGRLTVGDKFSDEQLTAMWASLSGGN